MKQKRSNHKIIIWSTSVSDLFEDNKKVGGIAVQLYFWAQTFARHGWNVLTFTYKKSFVEGGITYKHLQHRKRLKIVHEWLNVFWQLFTVRPDVVISRGADRNNYPLALMSKMLGIKFVFFGASDVNFEPGKELIEGGKHNRILWQKAVKKMKYIVVQNQHQHDTLKDNYGKDSLILFNIWGEPKKSGEEVQPTDVVWVANLRQLKRPEWIINAAKQLSGIDFTMVGGPTRDKHYYENVHIVTQGIPNLHFLGPKSFAETNAIVSRSRLLCCTSTFEGFPNTFLQAWSNGIPVVSTVNPSELITTHHLGAIVETEEEFQEQIKLLQNPSSYDKISDCVRDYFTKNHASEIAYDKLMNWLNIEYVR